MQPKLSYGCAVKTWALQHDAVKQNQSASGHAACLEPQHVAALAGTRQAVMYAMVDNDQLAQAGMHVHERSGSRGSHAVARGAATSNGKQN